MINRNNLKLLSIAYLLSLSACSSLKTIAVALSLTHNPTEEYKTPSSDPIYSHSLPNFKPWVDYVDYNDYLYTRPITPPITPCSHCDVTSPPISIRNWLEASYSKKYPMKYIHPSKRRHIKIPPVIANQLIRTWLESMPYEDIQELEYR